MDGNQGFLSGCFLVAGITGSDLAVTRPYFRRIAEDFDSRKFCKTSDDQTDPQADIPDLSPDALDRIRAANRHLEADFHSSSSVLPGV